MSTDNSHPNPSQRWHHMRRMAYAALLSGCLYPLLVFQTQSDVLATMATPFYLFVAAVVGAYMGFSSWRTEAR